MEKKQTMADAFSRTRLILGSEAIKKLKNTSIAVFGIGGVGSYAAESLARAGIGHIMLVDNDTVCESNLNRQLTALHSTIGKYKTRVMKERIFDINPEAQVITHEIFILPSEDGFIHEPEIPAEYDYIIDAIDTVSAKIALILTARRAGIPIISAMGCGNKTGAEPFKTADIYETSVCPLCRVMRRELKKRGVEKLKVIYSTEKPVKLREEEASQISAHPGKTPPGSLPWVPSAAGLILAGEVIRDILKIR